MSDIDIQQLQATVDALEARVQQLKDREEIEELRARYFRFVDDKDWEGFAGVFTEDCRWDLGTGEWQTSGRAFSDAVKGFLETGPGGRAISVHRGYLPEITFDSPTEAHGRWCLADYIEWPRDPSTGHCIGYRGYGHEFDTYKKVDGEWKIASWQLMYVRMDPLPREPRPDTMIGGPAELHDESYLSSVTS